MNEVFAFEVGVRGKDWSRTVNARTRGRAKSEYLRDVLDAWPNIRFTDLTCRKIGQPFTSSEFIRNARYRGVPDARCGSRVKLGDAVGTVVGHNASANFLVLFDEDSPKYAGLSLSVHPTGITWLK